MSENFVFGEFADINGVAYALEPIPVGKLIELRRTSAKATWRLAVIDLPLYCHESANFASPGNVARMVAFSFATALSRPAGSQVTVR